MTRRHMVVGGVLLPVDTVLEVIIQTSDQNPAQISIPDSWGSLLGELSHGSTASSVAGLSLGDSGYGSNSDGEQGRR